MIRILRIVTRLNVGGPTHHVRILSGALDRRRFQTLLLAGRPAPSEGDLTGEVRQRVHLITVPELGRALRPLNDLRAWWRLFTILRRFQPDIVHTHMAKAGALGRSAAWCYNAGRRLRGLGPCRIIHTFHGHVLEGYFRPGVTRAFLACERGLGRASDRLIAINRSVEQALLEWRIGRPGQVTVVPLGLPLAPLFGVNGHNAPGTPIWRIGTVGRLVPVKDHRLLFEALARLRQAAPGLAWSLTVAGDGELRQELERFAERLGLRGQVRFQGWRRDLPQLYEALDVVCLTSKNEGSPVALIEALAACRPVIGTDVGGVGELLGARRRPEAPFEAGTRGLVVRPGDPDAFAAALAWAAAHRQEHAALARAGRHYVADHLTAERLISDMAGLYEALVERKEGVCTHS